MSSKIFPLLPLIVFIWLVLADKAIHADANHVAAAVTHNAALAVLNPALRGEVCRLSAVVTVIVTSVVTVGEGDHDLTSLLSDLKQGKFA